MRDLVANSGNLGVSVDAVERVAHTSTKRLGPVHYSSETIGDFETAICQWLEGHRANNFSVGYVNPHVFNIAWNNQAVRQFLSDCDIVAVDGLGVAVAVSLIHRTFQTRTVMTPLFERVLEKSRAAANAILIGGSEDVLAKGTEAINSASAGMRVTVTASGYEPMETYLKLIEEHPECDVLLAAMGSPRSEELILAASKRFTGKLLWNIGGGTLHFHAGTQARTPRLVSAIGMQWLWRMAHQPSIAPRYVIGTPLYLFRLLVTLIRPRKFNVP